VIIDKETQLSIGSWIYWADNVCQIIAVEPRYITLQIISERVKLPTTMIVRESDSLTEEEAIMRILKGNRNSV